MDRNIGVGTTRDRRGVSLSARRAWIEIYQAAYYCTSFPVALRKESVDRNPYIPLAKVRHCESLSARRAWIEI